MSLTECKTDLSIGILCPIHVLFIFVLLEIDKIQ